MNASARLYVLAAAVLVAGCDFNKTSTPTSPDIAGPLAGVTITAPRPLQPAAGTKVVVNAQPVTLVVENATTSGPRAISLSFEVNTDPNFAPASRVWQRDAVAPGDDGKTTVTVANTLTSGRAYHWRVRALDGANTSPYSDAFNFMVVDPVVLQAPGPISPVGGERVGTRQPTLRVANSGRSGAPGPIYYEFEISASDSFVATIATGRADEQGSETSFTVPDALPNNQTIFWRARAVEATAQSPWMAAQMFLTPASIAPPPPGNPNPPPAQSGGIPSASEGMAMIAWVIADMKVRGINMHDHCGAWEITRRVAWQFRDRGAGLEFKPGGANCNANSVDIILFSNGQSVDILIGAGADNVPAWQLGGIVPLSWWIAPTNPDGGGL